MDNLFITYGISKSKKILNIVIGAYLVCFSLHFCISEGIDSKFSVLFFCSLIAVVLAFILILSNTLWLTKPSLSIDDKKIDSYSRENGTLSVDWARVSKVNIGMNYIVFAVNGGQKQQKLELVYLTYKDMVAAKSKVIEFCEYKNIPYQND